MVNFSLRAHPDVIFAYKRNHVELIIRVDNDSEEVRWLEADVLLPEKLSLGPDSNLQKGRLRIGILGTKESLEKPVKVYANTYTKPQMYRCKVTLYTYGKDGVIDQRLEKSVDVRCEFKKEAVL